MGFCFLVSIAGLSGPCGRLHLVPCSYLFKCKTMHKKYINAFFVLQLGTILRYSSWVFPFHSTLYFSLTTGEYCAFTPLHVFDCYLQVDYSCLSSGYGIFETVFNATCLFKYYGIRFHFSQLYYTHRPHCSCLNINLFFFKQVKLKYVNCIFFFFF